MKFQQEYQTEIPSFGKMVVAAALMGGASVACPTASVARSLHLTDDRAPSVIVSTQDANLGEPLEIQIAATSEEDVTDAYFPILLGQDPRWDSLASRIDDLAVRPNDWKGQGSLAVSSNVVDQAKQFLRTLALEETALAPQVGLDFEGTLSFFWNEDGVVAELTIYGDGTYSYFARRDDQVATEDEADIDHPIDSRLLNILSV